MNYNAEITKQMVDEYLSQPSRQTVEVIAKRLEKSIKSVIGKLSREGVYRREVYKTKRGEVPETKLEIVANISAMVDVDLTGLEKAPKGVLKALEKGIDDLFSENGDE